MASSPLQLRLQPALLVVCLSLAGLISCAARPVGSSADSLPASEEAEYAAFEAEIMGPAAVGLQLERESSIFAASQEQVELAPFVNPAGVITVPIDTNFTILVNHTVAGGGQPDTRTGIAWHRQAAAASSRRTLWPTPARWTGGQSHRLQRRNECRRVISVRLRPLNVTAAQQIVGRRTRGRGGAGDVAPATSRRLCDVCLPHAPHGRRPVDIDNCRRVLPLCLSSLLLSQAPRPSGTS